MNPFGPRDEDPLLQDDPLAPSADPDEESNGEATDETKEDPERASESSLGAHTEGAEESDSLFAATTDSLSDASSSASDSDSLTRADILSYLLENRAALDVLFEMMAFDRADGEETEYRQFLNAMRERHEVAIQQYREALEDAFPEVDLGTQSSASIDDDPPVSP